MELIFWHLTDSEGRSSFSCLSASSIALSGPPGVDGDTQQAALVVKVPIESSKWVPTTQCSQLSSQNTSKRPSKELGFHRFLPLMPWILMKKNGSHNLKALQLELGRHRFWCALTKIRSSPMSKDLQRKLGCRQTTLRRCHRAQGQSLRCHSLLLRTQPVSESLIPTQPTWGDVPLHWPVKRFLSQIWKLSHRSRRLLERLTVAAESEKRRIAVVFHDESVFDLLGLRSTSGLHQVKWCASILFACVNVVLFGRFDETLTGGPHRSWVLLQKAVWTPSHVAYHRDIPQQRQVACEPQGAQMC